MDKLTPKQRAFCDYYLQSFNATEAAIKAGYSSKTASEMGHENLRKPHLQDYIQARVQKKENKRIMQADEVLELLTRIATGEEKEQYINKQGEPVEATPQMKDRLKAVELLGKSHKLFVEKIEQDTVSEIEVTIEVV